ncbi:Mss4-like protein, partial [Mycena leptocephala]
IICHCTDCKQTSGSAFSTNVLAPQKDVTISGPVGSIALRLRRGIPVLTRIFCTTCGSAISHLSAAFGDAQAIQTGNFPEFAGVKIGAELFVKDRWAGLAPVSGVAQVQTMPA